MKSPEFVTHGTSSEKDAEKIKNEGFKAQEGRATVSGDLIYSFEWATRKEKRTGSKSETEIEDDERRRMVIMKVPEDLSVDYATNTDIEINSDTEEITGYTAKYESGRKQLAIYDEVSVVEKREKIEKAKKELEDMKRGLADFLSSYGIDYSALEAKGDPVEAKKELVRLIEGFEIQQKIDILSKTEDFLKQINKKRKEARPDMSISQENILMSIVPTEELGSKLKELSDKIQGLEKIDLIQFTEELANIIEENKENFLTSGLDVKEVVANMLETTMEAEVVNMVRNLFMDVKRANGYEVYNRGDEEISEKAVNKEELKQKRT
jgi:hypothetical protein